MLKGLGYGAGLIDFLKLAKYFLSEMRALEIVLVEIYERRLALLLDFIYMVSDVTESLGVVERRTRFERFGLLNIALVSKMVA